MRPRVLRQYLAGPSDSYAAGDSHYAGRYPRSLRAQRPALYIHQLQDHRCQDELHGKLHLAARANDDIRSRHERVVNHREQVLEIESLRVGEADDDEALVGRGYVARGEGIRGIHGRNALEIDVGLRELRANVVHIVGHSAQDRVDDRLRRVAARLLVSMELLDPLEIDDRHDADGEIGVPRDIHLRGHHRAVQALVEQHVGVLGDLPPLGEGTRLLLERLGLFFVVQIAAYLAAAALAVSAEQLLELLEQIVRRTEVAEMIIAPRGGLGQLLLHFFAIVTMERIALDHYGVDPLAAKDPVEGAAHRRRAGARRPGDRDDGMFVRHGFP